MQGDFGLVPTRWRAAVDDVIQCDPSASRWGPVFVIVTDVKSWGVQGYFFTDHHANQLPGCAPVRINHGHYVVIGQAAWKVEQ